MDNYSKIREKIIKNIDQFNVPQNRPKNSYFPDYLESKFNQYIKFYEQNLTDIIGDSVLFGGKNVLDIIKKLSNIIIKTINLYYEGKVFQASDYFTNELNLILAYGFIAPETMKKGSYFYRARNENGTQFNKGDLFHVSFENRNYVSTNRYSIPGFPTLYLGSSTYACWEEFEKTKLHDLWFVRLENQRDLKVVSILRIEDSLPYLDNIKDKDIKLNTIAKYLAVFPGTIAATIKVDNPKANFKPEYIFPQLLFEYIANIEEIDGLRFPSTKVNYKSLSNVEAYNFVFPVKKIGKKGYCPELADSFFLTEPTTLRLEEIINNSVINNTHIINELGVDKKIELIKDVKVDYHKTSFGILEKRLKNRKVYRIE